uniref:(northern house mosquito) hypothetical protein n=1 Tax=Culex pipiens TaxID=7175 RepID=A0A8D8ASB5_CULPI
MNVPGGLDTNERSLRKGIVGFQFLEGPAVLNDVVSGIIRQVTHTKQGQLLEVFQHFADLTHSCVVQISEINQGQLFQVEAVGKQREPAVRMAVQVIENQ